MRCTFLSDDTALAHVAARILLSTLTDGAQAAAAGAATPPVPGRQVRPDAGQAGDAACLASPRGEGRGSLAGMPCRCPCDPCPSSCSGLEGRGLWAASWVEGDGCEARSLELEPGAPAPVLIPSALSL